MKLGLPIVWSDRHRRHEAGGEAGVGVRTPGTEVPPSAEAIRDALRARDAPFVAARPHPEDDVRAVRDAAVVDSLPAARDDRTAAGVPADAGQDRVVRYVFAHAGLTPHDPPAVFLATGARRAAVGTAADLVATGEAGPARALVVPLDVDAASSDPESPLDVTEAGYHASGRVFGAMGLPTVLVEEGGNDLTTIGALGAETLAGLQEEETRA